MMDAFYTRERIDVDGIVASVGGPGRGAATVFIGTVRSSPEDGEVLSIEYSAYEEMLSSEFDKILSEAAGRWPGGRFAAQHRLGVIPVGEASIAVAASTPHRAESFDACRYIIEEVKKRLPVWKKERFEGGSEQWRENGSLDSAD